MSANLFLIEVLAELKYRLRRERVRALPGTSYTPILKCYFENAYCLLYANPNFGTDESLLGLKMVR